MCQSDTSHNWRNPAPASAFDLCPAQPRGIVLLLGTAKQADGPAGPCGSFPRPRLAKLPSWRDLTMVEHNRQQDQHDETARRGAAGAASAATQAAGDALRRGAQAGTEAIE